MTVSTLFLELRRSRVLVLGIALVTFAYGGIMGAMYPILAENQSLLDEYMKVFPKEFLAAFGMTGSDAAPLTELFDVFQRQIVAGQIQQAVE